MGFETGIVQGPVHCLAVWIVGSNWLTSVGDGVGTAGGAQWHSIWTDDAQVTHVFKIKRVAEVGESPGVHVWVTAVVVG